MRQLITFGKHQGKSFEWIFFKDPSYARWLYDNDIHLTNHTLSAAESEYFEELFQRASCLAGTCRRCNMRSITRMALSYHNNTNALGAVGFYCDVCEYTGGSRTEYLTPSFFVTAHRLSSGEQLRITAEIASQYIGSKGNLTQRKMEIYFSKDENFKYATPGFFTSVKQIGLV